MNLRFEDVSVRYGRANIFSDVNLTVRGGEVTGLIGPNGAGKTTLLRVAAGLIRPRRGRVIRHGAVLYFGGESTLPAGCAADRWSALVSSGIALPGVPRQIRKLSRGMRQLVGLRAWLARDDWSIGLLDEPWEGLDPDGARWLGQQLHRHQARGAAIVVSSHRLHDVAEVCTSFAFLASGTLRAPQVGAEGRPDAAALARLFDELRGRP